MEARKKILYLITKSNFGGAQRHVFDLATNLSKDKYDIVVALGGSGLLKTKLESAGIRTISIPSLQRDIKFLNDLHSLFQIFSIIKKEKPDIVHSHSSKAGGLGSFSARILRIPKIIFTAHGWPFKEKRGAMWRIGARFFSWLTIILANKTITVSKDDELLALDFVGVNGKIVCVHNGIGSIAFSDKQTARTTLLPNRPFLESEIWIGTISELHKNKGLDFAIRAFADLPKSSTIFVIISEGEERKKLETLISELNLNNRVFLTGHIDNAATYLQAFDIFTLTSLKEGLSYTVLEAGAAKLAVIASGVGGIPEIISDMSSGILVKPAEPSEIKKAILYLLAHPDRRAIFGRALAKNIAENFSLEKMITQTEMIYGQPAISAKA